MCSHHGESPPLQRSKHSDNCILATLFKLSNYKSKSCIMKYGIYIFNRICIFLSQNHRYFKNLSKPYSHAKKQCPSIHYCTTLSPFLGIIFYN